MVHQAQSRNNRNPKTSSRNISFTASTDIEHDLVNSHSNEHELDMHKSNEAQVPLTIAKFAKLNYGDNKELIFNVNCQVQFLMDYFRLKCKDVIKDCEFDLADLDGNVKNLREKSARTKLAIEYIKPRETVILVEIKQLKADPLLFNSDLINAHFLKKISQLLNKNIAFSNTSRLSNPKINIINASNETIKAKGSIKSLKDDDVSKPSSSSQKSNPKRQNPH